MSLPVEEPRLAPPPREYDPSTFANWLAQFEIFFKRLNNRGPVMASTLRLTNLPTSAAGLVSGEVWHDTSNDTLKIVP